MKKIFVLLLGFIVPGAGLLADEVKDRLEAALAGIVPGTPDSITPTPAQGLYEVVYGARVFYLTEDGQYLIDGQMIDLNKRTNLTEERRAKARLKALASIDESSMIIFAPKGETKHTISVFTDIDCGYCRKLHQEMPELNKLGIKVRYLSFPRAGIDSPSYDKAVSVWCAKDRKQAMNDAKLNNKIEAKTCENPVRQHMAMGEMVGVTGTPAIVLEDGRLMPGYAPAQKLLEILDKAQQ